MGDTRSQDNGSGSSLAIGDEFAGQRLDAVLAALWPEYSRSRLQRWIKDGQLTVNGQKAQVRQKVIGGELVELDLSDTDTISDSSSDQCEPQAISLDVVAADADIVVINKPSGLVMHPAAGNPDGTVQNALLYHFPETRQIPRAGIVHRLDKDTTGLFVAARSLRAHHSLVQQLESRSMGREYEAVARGSIIAGGTVDTPIGRHAVDRKRMAVRDGGKTAVTHYRVLQRFKKHAHIAVKLETGRTHQIRVHMASIHHPLVGDKVYGGRAQIPAGFDEADREFVQLFPRQALHARQLTLQHPATGDTCHFESPLPDDFVSLLQVLERNG